MSRSALLSDLQTLLRKHAARFVNEVDANNLQEAKKILEQALALMGAVL